SHLITVAGDLMTSFPMGMNALFHRFHYFISQLVRGKDHVCACTCGRHQVYHVVPYNEVQSMVVSRENNFLSDILTQQKMDVIVGLFLGICISYVLLWLNRVWFPGFKIWRYMLKIWCSCPLEDNGANSVSLCVCVCSYMSATGKKYQMF
uniref:Uncharacterized protein n=1 Tax=Dicentrarchus labrax TaxID=13489 RepID=A0A8C4EDY1_DICLA